MGLLALFSVGMTGCWVECDGWCEDDYYYDDWGYDYSYDCWYDDWDGRWVCPGDNWGCSSCNCDGCSDCNNCDHSAPVNPDPVNPDPVNPDPVDPDAPVSCIWKSDCGLNADCVNGFCVSAAEPIVEPEPECRENADCGDDMLCTDGRCIPCQTDVCDTSQEIECVFSSDCESGLCVDGACLAPGACAIDSNCLEGQICLEGACIARPECLADSECPDGQICNASNKCEDDVECRVDADCGEGLLCLSNMCAQCRLNCECPNEGDICMNGACVAGR